MFRNSIIQSSNNDFLSGCYLIEKSICNDLKPKSFGNRFQKRFQINLMKSISVCPIFIVQKIDLTIRFKCLGKTVAYVRLISFVNTGPWILLHGLYEHLEQTSRVSMNIMLLRTEITFGPDCTLLRRLGSLFARL